MTPADAELSVRRSAGWLTLSTVIGGALNFLYALALTWLLPLPEYPAFAAAQALLVVCGTAAAASAPWVLTHRLARDSPPSVRRDAVTFAATLTIVQGLLGAAIVGVVAAGLSRGHPALPLVAAVCAFLIFGAATTTGYIQGRQQFGRLAALLTGEVLLKIVSGISLVRIGAGAVGAIGGIGIGAVAVVAAAGEPLLRDLHPGLRWMRDRELWRLLFGLTGVQVGIVALINLDLIIGTLASHDNAALAGYQVSVVLSRPPYYLAGALSVAVFTKLASRAVTVEGIMSPSLTALLYAVVPVSMAIFTLPLPVARLFLPHSYPDVVESFLPFTAPASALASVSNLLTTYFQAEGRFRACCLLLAAGLGAGATAIVAGVLTLGVRGLAYASLASQLLMVLLLLVASGRTWRRAAIPRASLLLPIAASAPLLYLRAAPALWLVYATSLCATAGWFALFRSWSGRSRVRMLPAAVGRRWRPDGTTSGARGHPARPRVYLLTAEPVAPPWDGADRNLARALVGADIGVEFTFVGDHADRTPWPACHHRRALRFRTGVPTLGEELRLFSWLCRDRADVDLVHMVITFRKSALKEAALMSLPLLRGRPLIVTCPSGHHLPPRLLRRASAVVALSRKTERELRRRGLAGVQRISPGIDLDRFRPAPQLEGEAELGLDSRPTLLFAGHYDEGGGLEAAVDVLHRLKPSLPSLRLLTAMRRRPWHSDERRRAESERRIAELGLADSVVALGANADIPAALHASIAVLFQPTNVGIKMDLPMVLLEALASGRPIIVSPADSLGELADGSPAVLVEPPGGGRALEHIRRLVSDPDYSGSCGVAARRLAEDRYSAGAMVAAYADLYASLLGEPTRRRAAHALPERRRGPGSPQGYEADMETEGAP